MSILIKGMEMPKSCGVCPFCVPEADEDNGDICVICGQFPLDTSERSCECPLIEVPKHGRLIDADELLKPVGSYEPIHYSYVDGYVVPLRDISNAPTIIPADKDGEE